MSPLAWHRGCQADTLPDVESLDPLPHLGDLPRDFVTQDHRGLDARDPMGDGLDVRPADSASGHPQDDRLVLESAGGGGWGIPFQRSIMRLEEDLVRGIIGPDQSRNRYGLVLKPGGLEKDDYLTYRVRHYLLSTLAVEDIIAGEELLD